MSPRLVLIWAELAQLQSHSRSICKAEFQGPVGGSVGLATPIELALYPLASLLMISPFLTLQLERA